MVFSFLYTHTHTHTHTYCRIKLVNIVSIIHDLDQHCKQRIKVTRRGIRRPSCTIRGITSKMVEIREGQKRIKEGQKEVRKKFKEIRKESKKLKDETDLISRQSAANQLRLDLMFQIVKARADNDSAKDAHLTRTLRFVAPSSYTLFFNCSYSLYIYTSMSHLAV